MSVDASELKVYLFRIQCLRRCLKDETEPFECSAVLSSLLIFFCFLLVVNAYGMSRWIYMCVCVSMCVFAVLLFPCVTVHLFIIFVSMLQYLCSDSISIEAGEPAELH